MTRNNRILIVEDSADIVTLMKRFYEGRDYVVQTAQNGKEALDILRSSTDHPAFILLDMMMPVMDGQTFRAEQLNDPILAAIPVVVMTAFNFGHEKIDKLQCATVLNKPVDLEYLEDLGTMYCS